MNDAATARWRLFWAKTDRSGARPEWTRPLWAHLLDVASVAELLWTEFLPTDSRRRLAATIGQPESSAGRWFSLLVGMHDVGKAIPQFQQLHSSWTRQCDAGLPFRGAPYAPGERVHHGHASIPILLDWLSSRGGVEWAPTVIEALCAGIGFHHGRLEVRSRWIAGGSLRSPDAIGAGPWADERRRMLDAIEEVWGAECPSYVEGDARRWPRWTLELCGWCTLADWLGSMSEAFDDVDHNDDLSVYLASSHTGARRAVELAGISRRASLVVSAFEEIFRDSDGCARRPRPLQVAAATIDAGSASDPTLTVIEAPTGEGKTEAALFLALREQAGVGAGFFIAMPSQATSNGLFRRVESFVARTHDTASLPANLVLVHAMSGLHPDQERLVRQFIEPRRDMSSVFDDERAAANVRDDARVETATWFLPKKRSLLAPYGVGTVDQALLSVLYAKHFFLRILGLAGKTVIFDEVHAYDTYMNELFVKTLRWLRAIGSHVIVLSATLPSSTRRAIIDAWSDQRSTSADDDAPYPAVWRVSAAEVDSPITFDAALSQSASLAFADPQPHAVAQAAANAAARGAAVGVIVNTVARAQSIYSELERLVDGAFDLVLFHARFPLERRREIESHVLERFGPTRAPGRPIVLVATQVAEQSLDIDVDVMFSDLAPIDLLLQRAGRLHRHIERHSGRRPDPFTTPRLTVLVADAGHGDLPDVRDVSGGGNVYEPAMLFRTWRLLRERAGWSLPDDYRALVEGVYSSTAAGPPDDLGSAALNRWVAAEERLSARALNEREEARARYIPDPEAIRSMAMFSRDEVREEDDAPPDTHRAYLAVTRLGGPSFQIVCLHESVDGRLWFDRATTDPVDASPLTPFAFARRLIECSVSLAGYHMMRVREALADTRWSSIAMDIPAVRHHAAMIFRDGHWRSADGRFHFEYSLTMGLIRHNPTVEVR
jgi:CRISPR-associated endonuclease/helicase Cas3